MSETEIFDAVVIGGGPAGATAAHDLARWLIGTPSMAYASVFAFEALLFIAAAVLAARLGAPVKAPREAESRSDVGPHADGVVA